MNRIRILAVTILGLLLTASAVASEDPAADLARCRSLVAGRKWEAALAAYGKLFTDHKGSPVVSAAAKDIEDDLKSCRFRVTYETPVPEHFFGSGAVQSFGRFSLKAVLVYEHPVSPVWEEESGFQLLDIRFRDKVTIEMQGASRIGDDPLLVLLCYDVEKQGGYLVTPGASWSTTTHMYKLPRIILRLDSGKKKKLFHETRYFSDCTDHKVVRDSTSIKLYQNGKLVAQAKDRTYRGGYVGIGSAWPDRFKITGRIDPDWWKKRLREHEDRAFREWQKKEWDPAKEIPAWVCRPATAAAGTRDLALPFDARDVDSKELADLIDRALHDEAEAIRLLSIEWKRQTGRTRRLLGAVIAIGAGKYRIAEKALDGLLAEMPKYAPALALRGLVRLWLRRSGEAKADFAAALAKDPALGWAHSGLVILAIRDGDLERADTALRAAEAAGATGGWLDEFPDIVHRARRGPLWSKVYSVETSHFRIASDHSRDLCRQTANLLEAAMDSYAVHFPDVEIPKRKARVYVFANREGYLGYARSVARDLTFAAGAYDPTLRELVLYLPVNRKHFRHTIRHEGFHRFLHEYLERAPHWFNEGCAEYFASATERFAGGHKAGAVHEAALATLRRPDTRLTPLPDLLRMPAAEFMRGARVHYPQSWALVHFLHRTKDREFRRIFREYFAALRAGQSVEDAYDACIAAVVPRLEKAYRAHIRSLED